MSAAPPAPLDAGGLAALAGGALLAGAADRPIPGPVSTDTRRLVPGEAFLALTGERYDGGRFVAAAVRAGAAAVIARPEDLVGLGDVPAIAVADPTAALHALARARRAGAAADVVGVTGSAGKTTTVAFLAALLAATRPTHATPGGYNTMAGVAATLAGAPAGTRALVVELAMYEPGHIAAQAALLRPTAGLITTVGAAHAGRAGGLAGVARAKAELISALPTGAPCVLPVDAPLLDPYRRDDLRTITHGPGGDVALGRVRGAVAEIRAGGETIAVRASARQPHNLDDLVAAVAMARALGVTVPADVELPGLPPLRWQPARLGPVELVLDCFNSSPPALRRALQSFAAEPAARRLAVLGAMADLGEATADHQHEAGALARALGVAVLVAVGEGTEGYAEGFAGETHRVGSPREARRLLLELGRPGDRALVKGARAARLERILA